MIYCEEKAVGSRRTESDDYRTTIETLWTIRGTTSELDARNALFQKAAATYYDSVADRSLVRLAHSVEQVGYSLWDASVFYGPTRRNGFSFDTTGGTAHVTQSLSTRAKYAPSGRQAADHKGAIGVTKDGTVEGVDIGVRALKFTETHDLPAATVTEAYVDMLAEASHKTNAQAWRTFAAESVKFLGATGQSNDEAGAVVPVTFHFEVSKHATLTIGDISGIEKRGWDYLWCQYEETEDAAAGQVAQNPIAVYVEKMSLTTDFNQFGI